MVTIEYTESTLPPSELASYPHDDWVSAVRVHRHGWGSLFS